jgi:creatinine amidohydrolase
MEHMSVKGVRDYLKHRRSVIIPMGVTEQHGYHLPLCTDALIATCTARMAGERIGMLVAPTINTSFSGGQLPGTININPNVMGLVVAEVLRSLAAQGFRNMFLYLCHGGSENARALDNSLKLLLRDDPLFEKVMLVLAPVWKFGGGWKAALAQGDWHAGWLETSMVMALAPDLVQEENMTTDAPALVKKMRKHPDNYQFAMKPVDDPCVVPRMAQRPEIKVGVMGVPENASVACGKQMVEEVVRDLCHYFTDLEKRRSKTYKKVAWTPEPLILE